LFSKYIDINIFLKKHKNKVINKYKTSEVYSNGKKNNKKKTY
jgi:hypothetical protein